MTQKHNQIVIHFVTVFALFLSPPLLASAAETFVPLVPLPGLVEASTGNWQEYINTLIKISVIVAALVAVVKLILAGAQYVLADVVTNKSEAKKQIWTSLIGLLIVLSAVTVLTRINPNLATLPTLGKVTDADFSRVPLTDNSIRASSREGQELLKTCKKIIRYAGDKLICCDNNKCQLGQSRDTDIQGVQEGAVYTAQEISAIIAANGGPDKIIDLGSFDANENTQELCSSAVSRKEGRELIEVALLDISEGVQSVKTIKKRVLCVMK